MKAIIVLLLTLAIIATISFGAWVVVRNIAADSFDINCEQYLKRAADASTIELAKEELKKAISYAEEKGLTDGVVSIFLEQPRNDVGYWYNNLISSMEELEKLPEDASALEKTNVLMKLRETLTDQNENGSHVTHPNGISIYPYNVEYFWWGTISFVATFIFWIAWFIVRETYYYW